MQYKHITVDTKIGDVIDHPAFNGKGNFLFPWDDRRQNHPEKTMRYAPNLHLWHTHMETQQMVNGVNRLIDDINNGKQVIYDIYSEQEKEQDPEKRNTAQFFFRGNPGAPFGIICPGGGFYYVGSLHTGFPVAMELNKHGYNAFVLNYRVGEYIPGEWKSNQDLIRAARFIREHSDELGVCPDDYAIGGESAGARITSNWGISEPNMDTLHCANAVFPVAAIESEYSMMWREPEQALFPTLEELGIGLVPYRPLARGFLTSATEGMFLEGAENTRFDEKHLPANMALKELLQDMAAEKNVTPAQLALAWILAQKPFIVPIPGTSRMESMEENVKAAKITFTAEELDKIDGLLGKITIVGERYDPDSENGQSVRK